MSAQGTIQYKYERLNLNVDASNTLPPETPLLREPRSVNNAIFDASTILITFLQIQGVLWAAGVSYPMPSTWLKAIGWTSLFNLEFYQFFTYMGAGYATPVIHTILVLILPTVVMLALCLGFYFHSKSIDPSTGLLKVPSKTFQLFVIFAFEFLYFPVAIAAVRAFVCGDASSTTTGASVVLASTNATLSSPTATYYLSIQSLGAISECGSSDHTTLIAVGAITSVLFLVGGLVLLTLTTSHGIVTSDPFLHEQSLISREVEYLLGLNNLYLRHSVFLSSSYTRAAAYMRSITCVFKVLIAIALVVMGPAFDSHTSDALNHTSGVNTSPLRRWNAAALCAILVIYFLLQLLRRTYRLSATNILSHISNVSVLTVAFISLVVSGNPLGNSVKESNIIPVLAAFAYVGMFILIVSVFVPLVLQSKNGTIVGLHDNSYYYTINKPSENNNNNNNNNNNGNNNNITSTSSSSSTNTSTTNLTSNKPITNSGYNNTPYSTKQKRSLSSYLTYSWSVDDQYILDICVGNPDLLSALNLSKLLLEEALFTPSEFFPKYKIRQLVATLKEYHTLFEHQLSCLRKGDKPLPIINFSVRELSLAREKSKELLSRRFNLGMSLRWTVEDTLEDLLHLFTVMRHTLSVFDGEGEGGKNGEPSKRFLAMNAALKGFGSSIKKKNFDRLLMKPAKHMLLRKLLFLRYITGTNFLTSGNEARQFQSVTATGFLQMTRSGAVGNVNTAHALASVRGVNHLGSGNTIGSGSAVGSGGLNSTSGFNNINNLAALSTTRGLHSFSGPSGIHPGNMSSNGSGTGSSGSVSGSLRAASSFGNRNLSLNLGINNNNNNNSHPISSNTNSGLVNSGNVFTVGEEEEKDRGIISSLGNHGNSGDDGRGSGSRSRSSRFIAMNGVEGSRQEISPIDGGGDDDDHVTTTTTTATLKDKIHTGNTGHEEFDKDDADGGSSDEKDRGRDRQSQSQPVITRRVSSDNSGTNSVSGGSGSTKGGNDDGFDDVSQGDDDEGDDEGDVKTSLISS